MNLKNNFVMSDYTDDMYDRYMLAGEGAEYFERYPLEMCDGESECERNLSRMWTLTRPLDIRT